MKHFLIKIPPANQKKAEYFVSFLTTLHETLGNRFVSFEMVTEKQHISFRFSCHESDASLVSGQVYSLFPEAEIMPVEDAIPLCDGPLPSFFGGEISLSRSDLFPIKYFSEFSEDSLSGLLSVLSKASPEERSMVQLVVRPQKDTGALHFFRSWKRKFEFLKHLFRVKYWFKKGNFKRAFEQSFAQKESEKLFSASYRFAVFGAEKSRYLSIQSAFSQFNTIDLNRFSIRHFSSSKSFFHRLKHRKLFSPYLLSQSEIATLFHLPNEREVPNILYVLSKKSDAPAHLPTDSANPHISFFGESNFHGNQIPFGILAEDRRRHLYTIGKSGSGKSKFLELLIQNDLQNGRGVAVLDPHGDLVDAVLKMIPKERISDVVIFDPADDQFPISFNPLEKVPSHLKMRVTIGFIEIFKKLFGSNWTGKLEHVLRYTVLALLDSPNTTVLSILKMLSDKNYRQYIVKNIEDDVVKNFWVNEFAGWSEKFDAEAITPLLNKVGQFVATNMIRNIVGQPENKVNFREIMDSGKILLMKVSKGMLGEENAGLLGAMAVTKIYQAAMSRADISEEDRRDFYFYIDEFHNFATDTFDEILSEARKYRLNITIAHQFMGQLSSRIQKTIFGNVGSLVSFRVGAEDAAVLAEEYNPIFTARDIINLGVREFYAKMTINGEITQAFSGRTLSIIPPAQNYIEECLEFSRKMYCCPVAEVQKIIQSWEEGSGERQLFVSSSEEEFVEPIL